METDERLQRIESDIHEMKADMSDIKVSLAEIKATLPHVATKESVAKIETTLESTLPHLATKAEVEEAKHEATKGKYGLFVGVIHLEIFLPWRGKQRIFPQYTARRELIMARIIYAENPETVSVVELGEKPAAMALLVMDEQTKQALINLVNERRRILRERVPSHVPVVEPVTSVEEALLDVLGGIGAAGGASWFYRNFGSDIPHFESNTPQEHPSVAHALPMKE